MTPLAGVVTLMRPDMFKVIVERPRLVRGGGGKSEEPKGYRRRLSRMPQEDWPKFESNARHRRYGWWAKPINRNLAPLRRYLRKQVGRPWDEVYSEIRDRLFPDSPVKSHLLDLIRLGVDVDVVMYDGRPYDPVRSFPMTDCL